MSRYLVLGARPWSIEGFDTLMKLKGSWKLVSDPKDLSFDSVATFDPDLVFVLHWSELIPPEIVRRWELVGFHMTDLPYGRGGSPLQNLISRGHTDTVVSAYRMTEEFDAGPVYVKRALSLHGSAWEIYRQLTHVSVSVIKELIEDRPEPVEQVGDVVVFRRRKPADSEIGGNSMTLEELHDHIRMVDAPGYPKAYLEAVGLRFEFEDSRLEDGHLRAAVTIREVEQT